MSLEVCPVEKPKQTCFSDRNLTQMLKHTMSIYELLREITKKAWYLKTWE